MRGRWIALAAVMAAPAAALSAQEGLAAVMAAPAAALSAQEGLAVELRGGAAAGSYAEAQADFELAPEPSIGATVSYAPSRLLGFYAGYSRSSFGCDGGFCASRGMTFTSQGVDAGVRLTLPVPAGPWVRAGIVSHSLRYESAPAEGTAQEGEAASGFGLEAGAGVEVRLGRRLSLTPGLRYVRYGAADEDGVAMVVGDVGLRIRL